ncbi:hypothetical protein H2199_001167 [Coniosporium tulheliwenetii]|uniref:Uncharacterized protein n=1 Tax=Coniosporium tulheliwenetii TaxID=3383036 RepID=A0ACC2ZL27_9PEZI|nr:hypothetical protein H2199_001167 [Cladosporium sp. JES 115]
MEHIMFDDEQSGGVPIGGNTFANLIDQGVYPTFNTALPAYSPPSNTGSLGMMAHYNPSAFPSSFFPPALGYSNLPTAPATASQTFHPAVAPYFAADFDDDFYPGGAPGGQSDVSSFLDTWRGVSLRHPNSANVVGPKASTFRHVERPKTVDRKQLQGDRFDIQGINWEALETTRETARAIRANFAHTSDRRNRFHLHLAKPLPDTDSFFRFRRMNTEHRAWIAHFQLRNIISATSQHDIYYAKGSKVMHTDAYNMRTGFRVTALTASNNTLVAGGFTGEYAITNLQSEIGTPPTVGHVTPAENGITNHAHAFAHRTSAHTTAAFCSNDAKMRILDCETGTFTDTFPYAHPINCAATSPDGRLRVVVGDCNEALITNAETGQPVEILRNHTDHAFACAWADDGRYVATGAQDSQIVVYDARWWRDPLRFIATELACPRSLAFSPVGGGKRVLLAAEADDVVNVIDAQTFASRQSLSLFGAIGGMSITPDGEDVFVACCDNKVGGILGFERTGYGQEYGLGGVWRRDWKYGDQRMVQEGPAEWGTDEEMRNDGRVVKGATARSRRGLGLGKLIV